MFKKVNFKVLAEKFCRTPLPDSVCADLCATRPGTTHRTGTNLLSVQEAEQMFKGIFEDDESLKAMKLDIHIVLDTLATAARGEAIDPEACQVIEDIVKAHGYGDDFNADDVQALYDCGHKGEVMAAPVNEEVEQLKAEIRRLKRLFHYAEECAEVIKVASKSARFGEDFINPATGATNKQELKEESADLAAVMEEIVECHDPEFFELKEEKHRKVGKWKITEEQTLALVSAKKHKPRCVNCNNTGTYGGVDGTEIDCDCMKSKNK